MNLIKSTRDKIWVAWILFRTCYILSGQTNSRQRSEPTREPSHVFMWIVGAQNEERKPCKKEQGMKAIYAPENCPFEAITYTSR